MVKHEYQSRCSSFQLMQCSRKHWITREKAITTKPSKSRSYLQGKGENQKSNSDPGVCPVKPKLGEILCDSHNTKPTLLILRDDFLRFWCKIIVRGGARNALDSRLNQFKSSNIPKVNTVCTQNHVSFHVFLGQEPGLEQGQHRPTMASREHYSNAQRSNSNYTAQHNLRY